MYLSDWRTLARKTGKLIKREEIKEELRLIEESDRDYITPSGKVYADYGNNMFYPKKSSKNKYNGYVYIGIHTPSGEMVNRRLHRILAKAYLPNPNNYPYVMHIDNNKSNYNLSNLKWGTESENTKQAFDDGLVVNAKGIDDSQSIPVNMYNLFSTELIGEYGSMNEASRETGIDLNTILNSCKYKYKNVKKPFYFRYKSDGNIEIPDCIEMYDYHTDELLNKYINCSDASLKTNISAKTIGQQVLNKKKPLRCMKTSSGVYFMKTNR